jgi:hypothetical protein
MSTKKMTIMKKPAPAPAKAEPRDASPEPEREPERAASPVEEGEFEDLSMDIVDMLEGARAQGLHIPYTKIPAISLKASGKVTQGTGAKDGAAPYKYWTMKTIITDDTGHGMVSKQMTEEYTRRLVLPECRCAYGIDSKQNGRTESASIKIEFERSNPAAMRFVNMWMEYIHTAMQKIMFDNRKDFGKPTYKIEAPPFSSDSIPRCNIYFHPNADGLADDTKNPSMFLTLENFPAREKMAEAKTSFYLIGQEKPIPWSKLVGKSFSGYPVITIPHLRVAASATGCRVILKSFFITSEITESVKPGNGGALVAKGLLARNPRFQSIAQKQRAFIDNADEETETGGDAFGGSFASYAADAAAESNLEDAFAE